MQRVLRSCSIRSPWKSLPEICTGLPIPGLESCLLRDGGEPSRTATVRGEPVMSVCSTSYAPSPMPDFSKAWSGVRPPIDPFALVKEELDSVSSRLRRTVLTEIPRLGQAADYFFQLGAEGKRLRPTMLLLMASSLTAFVPTPGAFTVDVRPPGVHPVEERRQQQRIAEITELIHVASLLHDDVIDDAETRRGLKALNLVFGNKIAILAGDFLLARASISLASLKNTDVVQLLSQVIEDLVSGEILQLSGKPQDLVSLDYYMRKTFFKTASLMANSCKAIALLSGQGEQVCQQAWEYGRHLGLAFQFVDDVMDFTSTSLVMGKPALNDLKSGLATAPVLFAAEEFPQLSPLILRRFKDDGDVALAQNLVFQSQGIQRTRDLAAHHAGLAAQKVADFPPALNDNAVLCREALTDITRRVLKRVK